MIKPSKLILVLSSLTIALVIGLFSKAAYASQPRDFGLTEGDTISAYGDVDVFIVNDWGYKRLFLNPDIFNFYAQLGFSKVKHVATTTRDAFVTSGLFRNCETNDANVYALEVTGSDAGVLHHVNLSGAQAVAQDPNFFHKVFCINTREFNWYPKSQQDYSSLSQVPNYAAGVYGSSPVAYYVPNPNKTPVYVYVNPGPTPTNCPAIMIACLSGNITGYNYDSNGCRTSAICSYFTPTPTPVGTVYPTVTPTSSSTPQPGNYVGFGRNATGGAGGSTYIVSNLNDSGAGSLRGAADQANAAGAANKLIIRFSIGGTINLSTPIQFRAPNITIDGFSAPNPGITINGQGLYFDNSLDSNIILQGFRVQNTGDDAIRLGVYPATGTYGHDIVVDHVSTIGGGDGNIDITQGEYNVTISNSILANNNASGAQLIKYLNTHNITLYHNLYASTPEGRMPQIAGATNIDLINNVMYDWSNYGTTINNNEAAPGVSATANLVGNFYISTVSAPSTHVAILTGNSSYYAAPGQVYIAGWKQCGANSGSDANPNIIPQENWDVAKSAGGAFAGGNWGAYMKSSPFDFGYNLNPTSAFQALIDISANVGMPYRNGVEQALINTVNQKANAAAIPACTPRTATGPAATPTPTPTPTPSPTPSPTPIAYGGSDLCTGLITDKLAHPMSAVAKPAYLASYIDPQFGTKITRITQASGANDVIKQVYSPVQAWNKDQSKIFLWHRINGKYQILDGRTYQFIKEISISPYDIETVNWSQTDPNILYYPKQATRELHAYNVMTDQDAVVHTFTQCNANPTYGVRWESHDYSAWGRNIFSMQCDYSDNNAQEVYLGKSFFYNADTDQIIAEKDNYQIPNIAPSGNLAIVPNGHGYDVIDTSFNVLRSIAAEVGHSSLGRDTNGHDVLNVVQFDAPPVGTLISWDLTTGVAKTVVGQATGWPYPGSGTHISSPALFAPGWVATSTIGYKGDGQAVLDSELMLSNIDTGQTCRVAHHRSHPLGLTLNTPYFAEPHVVISPDGKRMLFASDWGGGNTVDTYVVELPAYQH